MHHVWWSMVVPSCSPSLVLRKYTTFCHSVSIWKRSSITLIFSEKMTLGEKVDHRQPLHHVWWSRVTSLDSPHLALRKYTPICNSNSICKRSGITLIYFGKWLGNCLNLSLPPNGSLEWPHFMLKRSEIMNSKSLSDVCYLLLDSYVKFSSHLWKRFKIFCKVCDRGLQSGETQFCFWLAAQQDGPASPIGNHSCWWASSKSTSTTLACLIRNPLQTKLAPH